MGMRRLWTAVAMLVLAGAVVAQTDARVESARIERERQEVLARHERAAAACRAVFAVTACLNEAAGERRAALDELRRQRQVLDDARRRERAAQRLRAIGGRTAQADARGAEPPPRAAKAEPAKPASAPRPTPRRDPARVASAPAPASSGAAVRRLAAGESRHSNIARGKAMAEQRRLDSERRRLEAERHRQAVAQRNAERDRRRPPAAGLPVPEAASAAR